MGKWDALDAFRAAAKADDTNKMQAIVDEDLSFIGHENPDGLPLAFLAKVQQMQEACREGGLDEVRRLAAEDPRLIRHPWTQQRWRPLTQTICGGQHQHAIFDFLLDNGADLNDRVEDGLTVLHMAAWDGHIDFAKTILDLGFDVNEKVENGVLVLSTTDGLV